MCGTPKIIKILVVVPQIIDGLYICIKIPSVNLSQVSKNNRS